MAPVSSQSSQAAQYFLRSEYAAEPALGFAQPFWAVQERPIPVPEAVAEAWDEGYRFLEARLSAERLVELRTIPKQMKVRLIAQGQSRVLVNLARDAWASAQKRQGGRL